MTDDHVPDDVSLPDTDDDEVEPVELLVQLAEEGEIDPWDVDIVDATDAFLDRLDETDLRTSGRALFYASVLLRMKSDALLGHGADPEPEPEPWEVAMEGGDGAFDEEVVVEGAPTHEAKLVDLDGDGSLDIVGKSYVEPSVDAWFNVV